MLYEHTIAAPPPLSGPHRCSSPSVASGQTSVHYYRYELLTRGQESTYASEVRSDVHGRHQTVETDTQGRITRTAVTRDGQKISERVYSFAPDGKAASEYETFTGSEKTGRVRIQRNADGGRAREDYFTVNEVLTGYTIFSYRADSVEATSYTGDGKKRAVNVSFYSPKDILTRAITTRTPTIRLPRRFGLRRQDRSEKGEHAVRGWKPQQQRIVQLRRRWRFGPPGCFRPAGNWFAAAELVNGLTTKRLYDSSKELRYSYDERRR